MIVAMAIAVGIGALLGLRLLMEVGPFPLAASGLPAGSAHDRGWSGLGGSRRLGWLVAVLGVGVACASHASWPILAFVSPELALAAGVVVAAVGLMIALR